MSKNKVLKTKKDFYNFFNEIPTKKWARNKLVSHGRYCALGHLGVRDSDGKPEEGMSGEDMFKNNSPIAKNLKKIGGDVDDLVSANDGGFWGDIEDEDGTAEYPRRSIKESVLAYINSL